MLFASHGLRTEEDTDWNGRKIAAVGGAKPSRQNLYPFDNCFNCVNRASQSYIWFIHVSKDVISHAKIVVRDSRWIREKP